MTLKEFLNLAICESYNIYIFDLKSNQTLYVDVGAANISTKLMNCNVSMWELTADGIGIGIDLKK